MQKVDILVSSKEREPALRNLRNLGIVHVKHLRQPQSEKLTSLAEQLGVLDKALAVIEALDFAKPVKPDRKALSEGKEIDGEALDIAREIISQQEMRRELIEQQASHKEKLSWFKDWGKVNLSYLQALRQMGVFVRLYACPKNRVKKGFGDKCVVIVGRNRGLVRLALISLSADDSLNLKEVPFPGRGLDDLNNALANIDAKLAAIKEKMRGFSAYKAGLLSYRRRLLKDTEFYKVKEGMIDQERFCLLEGFCPVPLLPKLKEACCSHGWGYMFRRVSGSMKAPTLIKTPRWVSIIRPVFKFMGTVPGYNEYDISFWFLISFSLFFALLIGDAGYGLLFIFLTAVARKKFRTVSAKTFILMYVLSGATVIWGALSGTWFGAERIAQMPLFDSLVIERINSFVEVNQQFMMYVCFVIGVVHLTIAHGIVAVRRINSLVSLAQAGWICMLWALFFFIGKVVLNKPLPQFVPALAWLGVMLVVLFSSTHKNFLKRFGIALANLPLKVINSFADILSYLRLFVIGYVSVMVASSFNGMALELGFNSFLSGLGSAVILFFGHILNISLGLLSVLVHGIRLNMLEFSGHLGMEWTGTEYKPFNNHEPRPPEAGPPVASEAHQPQAEAETTNYE